MSSSPRSQEAELSQLKTRGTIFACIAVVVSIAAAMLLSGPITDHLSILHSKSEPLAFHSDKVKSELHYSSYQISAVGTTGKVQPLESRRFPDDYDKDLKLLKVYMPSKPVLGCNSDQGDQTSAVGQWDKTGFLLFQFSGAAPVPKVRDNKDWTCHLESSNDPSHSIDFHEWLSADNPQLWVATIIGILVGCMLFYLLIRWVQRKEKEIGSGIPPS